MSSLKLFSPAVLRMQSGDIPFPQKNTSRFWNPETLLYLDDLAPSSSTTGTWLFRGEAGLCGIISQGIEMSVDGRAVHDIAVLSHADQVAVGNNMGVFLEICEATLGPTAEELNPCLYCSSHFNEGDRVYQCPVCLSIYHQECWNGLSGKICCGRNCPFMPGPIDEKTDG